MSRTEQLLFQKTNGVAVSDGPDILVRIKETDISVAQYRRSNFGAISEISELIATSFNCQSSGSLTEVRNAFIKTLQPIAPVLCSDLLSLLQLFDEIAQSDGYRVLLTTVSGDMCRKFHTDINDLRLLCTYRGPGTLWLPNEAVNRAALSDPSGKAPAYFLEDDIMQAEPCDVLVIKGALYPDKDSLAAVHRSPQIEASGQQRLLLRMDTNSFLFPDML